MITRRTLGWRFERVLSSAVGRNF